ncbi:YveK family protein [Williamsia sp. SKLECPSW1]
MSEILELVRRRLVFIVLCGIVAVAVPAALATASPDSYRATSRLFVGTSAQDVTAANQGNLAAQSRVRTYGLMAVGPELLARAAQSSGVGITGSELAKRISVSTPPDTVLLDIAATAGDAQEAAALSDAVAQQLVSLVSQAERPLRGGSPSLGLLILQPADAGVTKVPVLQPTLLAAYGVGGLVLGAVIAILIPGRFRLVNRRKADGTTTSTPADETDAASPAQDTRTAPAATAPVADRSLQTSLDVPHPVERAETHRAPAERAPTERAAVDRTPAGRAPAAPPVGPVASREIGHNGNGHRPNPETNGWEATTDPRGWVSPFASSATTPAPRRRHRRESGAWQFGDSPDPLSPNGGRDDRRRDETAPS